MKAFKAVLCMASLACCFSSIGATNRFSAPSDDSPEMEWWRKSMETHDQRVGWWREARFGMFIHWGVYSALGNEYKGRKGGGYAEHIQRVLKIPIPEYRKEVAGLFNPTNFNADEWVATAKKAGMGYMIITAKHHDGFAMWPSRVSDYNITNCTPFKRDPMRELKDACQRQGLRFGFYYSHAFDWGEANGAGNDWDFDNPGGDKLLGGRNWWETRPEFLPKASKYVDEKAIPQLQELIRMYDPDIFWFDTPHKLPESENLRIMKAVRAASPRVVINGRMVRGHGDYDSTADRPAEFARHDGDWEGVPTTNESYAWSKNDKSHKPIEHFIQLLAKAAARGGNTLMNVGPMGDGRIDPVDVAILEGIGKWWSANGESIRGTTRTPLSVQAWGESTVKGNQLFLHVFDWPNTGTLTVGGLKSDVSLARILDRSAGPAIKVAPLNANDVQLTGLPKAAPHHASSVIVLDCPRGIEADPVRLLQPAFATNTLRVFDGQLSGKGLRFGPGKVRDAHVYQWSKTNEFISWPVRLNQPAVFEVQVCYDAEAAAAGDQFAIQAGDEALKGHVKAGTQTRVNLGRMKLAAGKHEIKWVALSINGAETVRPREVMLRAVAE